MRDRLSDKQRLIHISEAAGSIKEFLTNVSKEEFLSNYMLQLAVLKLLENIGVATNRLSKELQSDFTTIDWIIMIRSRNVYVHQYFALDLEIIWETAINDLPSVKEQIDLILAKRFDYP